MQDRRQFLRAAGTAGAFTIGAACPRVWHAIAQSAEAENDATKLVVIELTGGNDGLNTIAPVNHDVYRRSRPTLAIKPADAIMLSDSMGGHPALKPLMDLWENDQLAILQNVGYPNPNRSHFRSMEIWQSATVQQKPLTGWLGKLADSSQAFPSLFVGPSELPLAVRRGNGGATPSLGSIEEYQLIDGAALDTGGTPLAESDGLLASISRRTQLAAKMANRADDFEQQTAESPFDSRLTTIHRMMRLEPKTRVFYTTRDGFDTHQQQRFTHANLLQDVARSIARFAAALKRDKLFDQVLILVYSEFGRRVAENGSNGTDHGAAAPLFAIGGGVSGGLHGDDPNLSDLSDGDIRFQVDFRDVYATALSKWFQIDPIPILGRRDTTLRFLA